MSASFACVPRIVNSPAHLAVSIFSIDTRGNPTFLGLGPVHFIECDRNNRCHFGRVLAHFGPMKPETLRPGLKITANSLSPPRKIQQPLLSFVSSMDRSCGYQRPLSQLPL